MKLANRLFVPDMLLESDNVFGLNTSCELAKINNNVEDVYNHANRFVRPVSILLDTNPQNMWNNNASCFRDLITPALLTNERLVAIPETSRLNVLEKGYNMVTLIPGLYKNIHQKTMNFGDLFFKQEPVNEQCFNVPLLIYGFANGKFKCRAYAEKEHIDLDINTDYLFPLTWTVIQSIKDTDSD